MAETDIQVDARFPQDLFFKMSTVDDALTAVKIGVRDDGVMGGLFEIAQASGTGIVVDKQKIPVLPTVRAICDYFGTDPLVSISEGTLEWTHSGGL